MENKPRDGQQHDPGKSSHLGNKGRGLDQLCAVFSLHRIFSSEETLLGNLFRAGKRERFPSLAWEAQGQKPPHGIPGTPAQSVCGAQLVKGAVPHSWH